MLKKAVSLLIILASLFALCACESGSDEQSDFDMHCTLYVECADILSHIEDFDEDKLEVLPEDGVIIALTEVGFNEGESVYDIIRRETKLRGIHMEASYTPIYNSAYIEGINNIYEFDCGALSGWTYSVNGSFPHYGCSQYYPEDGDAIVWHYTCEWMPQLDG